MPGSQINKAHIITKTAPAGKACKTGTASVRHAALAQHAFINNCSLDSWSRLWEEIRQSGAPHLLPPEPCRSIMRWRLVGYFLKLVRLLFLPCLQPLQLAPEQVNLLLLIGNHIT